MPLTAWCIAAWLLAPADPGAALRDAEAKARAAWKGKQPAAAVDHLRPAVEAAKKGGYTDARMARTLNDLAFYLEKAGSLSAAEQVLRRVVAAAPQRSVARLNLGDVLWMTDAFDAARASYRVYAEATPAAKRPARVTARTAEQPHGDPPDAHLVACPLAGLPAGRVALSSEGDFTVSLLDWRRPVARGELAGAYENDKYDVVCEGRRVSVEWEAPYRSATITTELEWRGDALVRVGSKEADPSADALAEAEAEVAAGRVNAAVAAYFAVGYPASYFSADEVSVTLWKLAKTDADRAAVLEFDRLFGVERPAPKP